MSLEVIARVADEYEIPTEIARTILLTYADQNNIAELQKQTITKTNQLQVTPEMVMQFLQNPQVLANIIQHLTRLEQQTGQPYVQMFYNQIQTTIKEMQARAQPQRQPTRMNPQTNSQDQETNPNSPLYVPPGTGEQAEYQYPKKGFWEQWGTPMGAIGASNWLLDPIWWYLISKGQSQNAIALAQNLGYGGSYRPVIGGTGGRVGSWASNLIRGSVTPATPGETMPMFGSQQIQTTPSLSQRIGNYFSGLKPTPPEVPPVSPTTQSAAGFTPGQTSGTGIGQVTIGPGPEGGQWSGGLSQPRPPSTGLSFEKPPTYVPGQGYVSGSTAPLAGTGAGGTGLSAAELAASGLRAIGTSGEVGSLWAPGASAGAQFTGGIIAAVPAAIAQYYLQKAVSEGVGSNQPTQYSVAQIHEPTTAEEILYGVGSIVPFGLNPFEVPGGQMFVPNPDLGKYNVTPASMYAGTTPSNVFFNPMERYYSQVTY